MVGAALSSSWIATEYSNENNPAAFYSVGSEQLSGGSVIPDSNFVNQTGGGGACNGSGAAWLDGEMCATIPLSATTGVTQTTITSNGITSNSYSFTITLPVPGTPSTPTFSSVSTSTLTVSWSTPTGTISYYGLSRATSSGGTYAQTTTTTSLSYNDSGLTPGTAYWYKVRGVNATGNGSYSGSSSTTTTAIPPNAPSQDAPVSSAQNVSVTPIFLMTATDASGNSLQYKVVIYSNSGCTSVVQNVMTKSASQTGWSGQNASSGNEYSSGTQGSFTVQSALSQATTYYWSASAKDPEGSNTWATSATCNGFTTTNGIWTTDSGNWSISSNKLTVIPGGSGGTAQIHVTGQNITNDVMEFKMSNSGVTGEGVAIFRSDNGSNRYQIDMDSTSQQSIIAKIVSGSYTSLTTGGVTLSASTVYDVRAYVNGSTLQSWVNGSNALSTTDSALSGPGIAGLIAYNTGNTYSFTDFAIYTSPTVTLSGLPGGGSWSVLDHTGATIGCNTGGTWSAATYTGQIPVDYDNGGGKIAVWTKRYLAGASSALYPSSRACHRHLRRRHILVILLVRPAPRGAVSR